MATSAKLLEEVQGRTTQQMQDNEAAFVAAQSGASAAAELSESAAKILNATAEAQAAIVREDYIAKQRVEQAQRTAALAAGYDPAVGAGPMLDRIAAINKKGSEVVDLTKKLREERNVSIFQDPLAWIQANFLSDTQEQVQLAASELDVETGVLGQLNQAVQQTARTAEATAQTVTAAKIEAASKVAATEAQLKAIQAEQEGIRFRTAAVTARAELSNADLNALHTLRNATLAEQNYKLNLRQEARAREQFEWQKELQNIALEEKRTEQELDGYLTQTINYGNRLLGRPELTGIDAKVMVQLLKKGGSDELNKLYQIGLSYRMNPKNPVVGPDPATAYDNLISLQGRVTEVQKDVVEILKEVKTTLPRTAFDPKTGKLIDPTVYNNLVQETFAAQFNNIRPGSGNAFDVGEIAPYISAAPELQSLPFIQKVISPAIAANQPLSDPKVVIDLAIESAKRGDISMPQAISGVINIYQRANAMNQAARGFISYGIVPPSGGLAYNTRLGFGATVNLADPVSVGRYMSIQLATQTTKMFGPSDFKWPTKDQTESFRKIK